MVDCCQHSKKHKKCTRKKDKKTFKLPRKFSKKICLKGTIKGFSKKSSCAPYKGCKKKKQKDSLTKKKKNNKSKKKQFLYNPDDPKKSFDVYIDKNPNDTIPIKYKEVTDVKNTIKKLERLYKQDKYTHKRIWQVGMIMKVRLEVLKKKKPKQFQLANKYFKHLGKRSKIKDKDKKKEGLLRKRFTFKI